MKRTNPYILVFLFLQLLIGWNVAAQTDQRLEEIKKIHLPGFIINDVQDLSSGEFTIPGGKTVSNLPGFIRVMATSKPAPESKSE